MDYLKKIFNFFEKKNFTTKTENINTTTITTTTNNLNYELHPGAIYTGRVFNFSGLPEPKNEENFERKLEELITEQKVI